MSRTNRRKLRSIEVSPLPLAEDALERRAGGGHRCISPTAMK
ncbi:hypothetical protein ACFY8O_29120 [Streptomyces argenteolus]|uniref:Uncharacterized protein n=1 Tax=Streptomyces argenteolus TaxID=67274 RepID=A0ABW6XE04_9ACTN